MAFDRKVLEDFWTNFWILFWNSLEKINFNACNLNLNFAVSFSKGIDNSFKAVKI
jgi:hypothetical protein